MGTWFAWGTYCAREGIWRLLRIVMMTPLVGCWKKGKRKRARPRPNREALLQSSYYYYYP